MVLLRLLLAIPVVVGLSTFAEAGVASGNPFGVLAPAPPVASKAALVIKLIAQKEAQAAGVPFDLVDAVMKIESDYHPERIGSIGEIGLMQVRPGTAAMLGFHGAAEGLFDPAVNIHYGTTYLGQAWHLTNGDVCRTLMKYRAGQGENMMSARSSSYCERAREHLAAMRSPLVASINLGEFNTSMRPASVTSKSDAVLHNVAGRQRSSKGFWAAEEARVKKIDARIEAKWRHVASR